MSTDSPSKRTLGVAIVGFGGAVSTTAVAGMHLLQTKRSSHVGLPLAGVEAARDLVPYENLVFGGWDLCADDLAKAALTHDVLTTEQFAAAQEALTALKPWPAIGNAAFSKNVDGQHRVLAEDHRSAVELIRQDLRRFRADRALTDVVVINLASTESFVARDASVYSTVERFEAALDANAPEISPAMLYAYAAVLEGLAYGNFTPSVAGDVPALVELAERHGSPLAGKDGKTGQTMMKTVLAPAFRTRALHVDGWFSTNILGNRDGLALNNPESLKSKVTTKASALDSLLGYAVEDHIVDIRYYRPRGDAKEAWDNIDVTGFLGQKMQIKVNFLCRDSILAAPLVIEIARVLELAKRRGERGVQEQLGLFFKLPQTRGSQPEHALHRQEERLLRWLEQSETHAAR